MTAITEYELAIENGRQIITDLENQISVATWAGMKKVYEACEGALNVLHMSSPRLRGTPRGMGKIYHDIAVAASVSAASVRNAHSIYRDSYAILGDHDEVTNMVIGQSTVKEILYNNKLLDADKKKILEDAVKTKMDKKSVVALISSKMPRGKVEEDTKIFRTTLWKPGLKTDPRFGETYPGRLPYEIAVNVLYHYTREGDLCYFPFVGSGTEIDVARAMSRNYMGWDINHVTGPARRHGEKYFKANSFEPWNKDLLSNKRAHLIFADMPRFVWGDGSWEETAPYNQVTQDDIGVYLDYIMLVSMNAKDNIRENGVFALMLRQPGHVYTPKDDIVLSAIDVISRNMQLERRLICDVKTNIHEPQVPGQFVTGCTEMLIFRNL